MGIYDTPASMNSPVLGKSLDFQVGNQVRTDPRLDPNSPYYDKTYAENFFLQYGKQAIPGFAAQTGSPLGVVPEEKALPSANNLGRVKQNNAPGDTTAPPQQPADTTTAETSSTQSSSGPSAGNTAISSAGSMAYPVYDAVTTSAAAEGGSYVLPTALDYSAAGVAPAAEGGTTAGAGGMSAGGMATAGGIGAGILGAYYSSRNVEEARDRKAELSQLDFDRAQSPEVKLGLRKSPLAPTWFTRWDPLTQTGKYLANSSLFGGKDQGQINRDQVRNYLVDNKYLDEKYQYKFRDGGTFDFGLDGGAMLPNKATNEIMKTPERHMYDVDWSDPLAGGIVGAVDPLAIVFSYDTKTQTDMAGYFYNAAVTGKDPSQRIADLYHGVPGQTLMEQRNFLYAGVQDAYNQGRLTEGDRNAALATIDRIYNVKNPGQGQGGTAEYGSNFIQPGNENNYATKPVGG